MADSPRIEELKRRVQQDPASIAFAALADEYRRAGRYQDAVETCRAGLLRHPSYLSARVTLGRALLEIGEFDEAEAELQQVLRTAPENLAAIRALADIHHRRGDAPELPSSDPALSERSESKGESKGLEGTPAPADTPATAVSTVVPFAAPAATAAPPPPAPVLSEREVAERALSERSESKGPALSERGESKGAVPELERFLAAIQRARRELDSGINAGR
jgi:tetratricopeptide (TPR) repeat protein